MITKYELQLLDSHTNRDYAIITDGVVRKVSDNSVIPVEHLSYKKTPPDGMYELSLANCGLGLEICSIGKPQRACVEKTKIYDSNKCAVYFLSSDIETAEIPISVALSMIERIVDDLL